VERQRMGFLAVVVQHFTDMQEPSGIERRDMAITNNTPGEVAIKKRNIL
jgi:hypothetical protein